MHTSESVPLPVPARQSRAKAEGHDGERIPAIQGLRALAIIFVILYHVGLPLRGGFVGVDVFFVISGFVITRLIMVRQRSTGGVGFADFYRRRIRRLLPALGVMVSATLVVSMLLESPIDSQRNTAISGLGASMWLANAALYVVTAGYFAPNADHAVLLHTWSLSVEEQFYVVFPVLIGFGYWAALRRRRGSTRYPRWTVATLVLGIMSLSFAINYWLCYGSPTGIPAPQGFAFFSPFSRSWEFAIGALVALAARWLSARSPLEHEVLAGVGAITVLGAGLLTSDTVVYPGLPALLPVAGTALLIAGVVSGPTMIGRAFSTRPAVKIGDLSYSLYLWHWPFIAFAVTVWGESVPRQVAAGVLSVPAALFSYHQVEERFRHRRDRKGFATIVAGSVGVPVTLAIVLIAGSSVAWGNDAIQDMKSQVEPKSRVGALCGSSSPIRQAGVIYCRLEGASTKRQVVLLGDSNAGQYADGLMSAGRSLERTVLVATVPGCSMNLVEVYDRSGTSQRCLPRTEAIISWLKQQPASLVFIASADELVDQDGFALGDPQTGERARAKAAKARLWATGLERALTEIRGAGHRVVLIRAIPHFWVHGEVWTPDDCSFPQLLLRWNTCGPRMTIAAGDAGHRYGLAAEDRVAREAGLPQLDVSGVICPDGICAARKGNFWVYRDGLHITVAMSRKMRDTFVEAIKDSADTRSSLTKSRARPAALDCPGTAPRCARS